METREGIPLSELKSRRAREVQDTAERASRTPSVTANATGARDRPAEDRLRRLRHENSDLRRQLAESQSGVASGTLPKPYKNVTDQDHEKILAFIEKWDMDPSEDYDRALMGLAATGEIRMRR